MRIQIGALMSMLPLVAAPVRRSTPAPLPLDGYVITMQVTSTDAQQAPQTMTFKMAGDKLGLDVPNVGGGGGGRGRGMMGGSGYLLPQGDGKLTIVLPEMANPMTG